MLFVSLTVLVCVNVHQETEKEPSTDECVLELFIFFTFVDYNCILMSLEHVVKHV